MKDENGKKLSEEEILQEALNLISDACCLLFEIESPEITPLAFMTDAVLKLGQVIRNGDDPRSAAADYTAYENKKYMEFKSKKNLEVIK